MTKERTFFAFSLRSSHNARVIRTRRKRSFRLLEVERFVRTKPRSRGVRQCSRAARSKSEIPQESRGQQNMAVTRDTVRRVGKYMAVQQSRFFSLWLFVGLFGDHAFFSWGRVFARRALRGTKETDFLSPCPSPPRTHRASVSLLRAPVSWHRGSWMFQKASARDEAHVRANYIALSANDLILSRTLGSDILGHSETS